MPASHCHHRRHHRHRHLFRIQPHVALLFLLLHASHAVLLHLLPCVCLSFFLLRPLFPFFLLSPLSLFPFPLLPIRISPWHNTHYGNTPPPLPILYKSTPTLLHTHTSINTKELTIDSSRSDQVRVNADPQFKIDSHTKEKKPKSQHQDRKSPGVKFIHHQNGTVRWKTYHALC